MFGPSSATLEKNTQYIYKWLGIFVVLHFDRMHRQCGACKIPV